MPLVGCSETTGDDGSFDIVRDGQKQSYDGTTIRLRELGAQLVLSAWNTRDPIPDAADDESSDFLRVAFDKDATDELAIDWDYPISGESSWTHHDGSLPPLTFVGSGMHTAAVDYVYFAHTRMWCPREGNGAQTFQGTLSLTTIAEGQLAGVIEVRVEGDVPCTDNLHQFYELTLVFDQSYGGTGSDAGTDAGTPAAPTSPDFVVLRREREGW
jgi:hypothetical protein